MDAGKEKYVPREVFDIVIENMKEDLGELKADSGELKEGQKDILALVQKNGIGRVGRRIWGIIITLFLAQLATIGIVVAIVRN